MNTKIKHLFNELSKFVDKDNLLFDDLSLIAYGADAGCYQKIPQLVIKVASEEQMVNILQKLYKNQISATFRAGGTSLSGQAISDSVLLQARGDKWSKVEVLSDGKQVKSQPGITGNRLNQILKPYGVKFGADPASISSAMVGGIVANNASGMSCGTHANSYATIKSARIVFNDGTLLDTNNEESINSFKENKADFIAKIEELRDKIHSVPAIHDKIKEKYKIKNTTGYGLNSFLDYTNPIDIILHLMVGSEGTLGFLSEVTFNTITDLPLKASSMIYFETLKDACNAVPLLKEVNVSAIELLDRKALRSVEDKSGIPEYIKDFGPSVTALLIDLDSNNEEDLNKLIDNAQKAIVNFKLAHDFEITKDSKQIADYWKIRKGVFPSVGGVRKPGSSIIIEDIAVSLDKLTPAVLDIRKMLDDLNYKDAVIYGHALEGNLHFIFSQDFGNPKEVESYGKLIDTLTKLIVDKYNGSLKAEHGTGMNMAPFVEYEWGSEVYQIMKEVKSIFDPKNTLNPDVIITDDKELHLKNFKLLPPVDETVDQCIECGFCEINCVAIGYTISSRQRIVVQRELSRLKQTGEDSEKYKRIDKLFQFQGIDSCAGDGLCAISCPLSIDTGVFVKKLKNEHNKNNVKGQKWASRIANNFDTTQNIVKKGLGSVSIMQNILGNKVLGGMASAARFASFNKIPEWNKYMPQAVKIKHPEPTISKENKLKVVYFPSCINQSMGPAKGDIDQKPLIQVTTEVLERAGYHVIFPDKMNTLCCGTPWESKGFIDVANQKSSELEDALLKISENGKYPVLFDTSPCLYRMKKVIDSNLKLYEPVEFIHDFLLDKLDINKLDNNVAFHVTCSSTKMDLQEKFENVAKACVSNAIFPSEVGCCGFAGDKGFSQPKLNDWGLRKLKPQVHGCDAGYSNSRTCEIGLSKNSGIDYKSIMYLVNEASR